MVITTASAFIEKSVVYAKTLVKYWRKNKKVMFKMIG